jgi:hypothetical protein
MGLPINQAALYNVVVPSTGKTIKFRQFLVKEQKALLLAHQSEDEMVMLDTLKNIIKECVKDPIDIDRLATFDIEYIFVAMRAKSVGETVSVLVKCPHCKESKDSTVELNIDLTTLDVLRDPEHTNNIPLFDDVGVMMKYPSFNTLRMLRTHNTKNPDEAINIIIECIDYIYNKDEIFKIEDVSKKEIVEFIDNLTETQIKKIKTFLQTMPKVYKDISYVCPVCNTNHTKRLEGLVSFF